jgi:hypothetical protein
MSSSAAKTNSSAPASASIGKEKCVPAKENLLFTCNQSIRRQIRVAAGRCCNFSVTVK